MFINNYAHTSNALHIELNIYFTNIKKKMPNEGIPFNTKHVNAFTNAFMKSFENKVIISDHRNLNLFLKESKFKQVSELAMSDPSMWSWRLCEE